MEINQFLKSEYYENRELSWLGFNERVLSEARDKNIPLFERLKFLSITSSNLDEFFMIRVASLKDMVHVNYEKADISGLTPMEQLEKINKRTHDFVATQYSTYNRSLIPILKQEGLNIIAVHEDLTKDQQNFVDEMFQKTIYPVLTPMAVDSSRPFPLIRNKSLNIGALISKKKKKGDLDFATVQVPSGLPRIIELPESEDGVKSVILLEEVIERNLHKLFLNYDVICAHPYRIMRNADLTIEEDEASDLLKEIQKQLKKRQWGEVIRLEVEDNVDSKLLKILKKELDVQEEDIFEISGPLDLTFLMKMYGLSGFKKHKYEEHKPEPVSDIDSDKKLFEQIQEKDILMHHPYQSFSPVVEFVKQAAVDPNVLAIKQTLYRVSGNSPIIAALAQAAENGKQVSVLVELKARFDEENNIVWAKMLEKAGCHVIYGLVGLKTHCKITLVVRREEDGIRRYVHLGTGNYNDSTAKLYTDYGLFTCAPGFGEDATAVFNMFSGYSEPLNWNKLILAPLWLKDRFLAMIQRETAIAREGRKAHIIVKVNSLCDQQIIEALYEASAAGVKIELIVRGICSLKVGIPGVSENIMVKSIIGTFLEHSRVFYFYNDGREELYLGSADWMPRNLERRVEILFPLENEELKKRVLGYIQLQLEDNMKTHLKQADGTYIKPDKRGKVLVNSQEIFCEIAKNSNNANQEAELLEKRLFIPSEPFHDEVELYGE